MAPPPGSRRSAPASPPSRTGEEFIHSVNAIRIVRIILTFRKFMNMIFISIIYYRPIRCYYHKYNYYCCYFSKSPVSIYCVIIITLLSSSNSTDDTDNNRK